MFFSRLFSLLKVAPDIPRITDDREMQKQYKYWRFRVMYAMMFGYMGYYFVRKSLAVAMPVIEQEFNIPKAQLGLILTAFGITYGISKFINGFAGDRTNPRYFMALGLICSALINVFFGLSSGVIAFGVFWILNGWFQGMGWAPCSKTLVNWYAARERGVRFSITNTACSIGASGVVFLNGFLIVRYGWRSCFFVPAGIAVLLALFILNRLRDRPQSLGLPPVEEYLGEETDISDSVEGKSTSYKEVVIQYIFKNPGMWIVSIANFFVYVVRYSVLDWGTTFLTQSKGVDITQAAGIVGGYELAGLAGMLVGGWAMDKLFKGYGGRTCGIYMAFCTLFIYLFWKLPVQSVILNGALIWGTGFMIYGPQCLVAVIAVNMVPKSAGAAAVGLTGLFGYLSTILSGWGLGLVVDNFGWNTGFMVLVLSSLAALICFIMLWNRNPHLPGSKAHAEHENNKLRNRTIGK
ncbi:MAG TPA: MFS transporter [Candidatus Marinimicrobia bacterium]|nr:MFS transporter [Candidatus Neomarinimicrobiota bacterium]